MTATPSSEAAPEGGDLQLPRLTLADRIFEQLREQIIAGRVQPGQVIPSEQELGEAFGVGRTTVREALHGLVSSGFVERRGRALVVRNPTALDPITLDLAVFSSQSSIQHLYAARRLLEVEAVRLAAMNRTQDQLSDLRRHLERLDTDDPEAYHAADLDFHTALARASGNPVLHQLFVATTGVFFKRPAFWRVFSARTGAAGRRIGSGYDGHLEIFEAVERCDAELASQLMADHLQRVERGLIEALGEPAGRRGLLERHL